MLIGKKDYKCVPLDKHTSTSGLFEIFLGQHYHAGIICYVVGAYGLKNGELIQRHYNVTTGKYLTDESAKAAALIYWDEFRERMLAKPLAEEDENDPARYFKRRD